MHAEEECPGERGRFRLRVSGEAEEAAGVVGAFFPASGGGAQPQNRVAQSAAADEARIDFKAGSNKRREVDACAASRSGPAA